MTNKSFAKYNGPRPRKPEPGEATKTCSECGNAYPLDFFYPIKRGGNVYHKKAKCKRCFRDYATKYRAEKRPDNVTEYYMGLMGPGDY